MYRSTWSVMAWLGLGMAAWLFAPSMALAQHHGGGGHASGSHGGGGYHGGSYHGGSSGYHGGGYHGGSYGNRYYGGSYYHNRGYYGGYYPGYLGLGYSGLGYPGYYGYSSPSYYYSYPEYNDYIVTPDNTYVPPVSLPSSAPSSSSSYYGSMAVSDIDQSRANIRVTLPAADAEIWFNGSSTRQSGAVRDFASPPLTPGKSYSYEIRARWRQGDREMDQTKTIDVHAGDSLSVTFPQSS